MRKEKGTKNELSKQKRSEKEWKNRELTARNTSKHTAIGIPNEKRTNSAAVFLDAGGADLTGGSVF